MRTKRKKVLRKKITIIVGSYMVPVSAINDAHGTCCINHLNKNNNIKKYIKLKVLI